MKYLCGPYLVALSREAREPQRGVNHEREGWAERRATRLR